MNWSTGHFPSKTKKNNDMKPARKTINAIVVLFALSPLVYLLLVWGSVPETITTTFDFKEPLLKAQSRQTLLVTTIGASIVTAVIYLLMSNLHKIDPKAKDKPTSGFNRLGLSVVIF